MKKFVSIALILSVMTAAAFVFAKISARPAGFEQAEDFPRDALIYVQIQDLPALIKLWNDSELRRKYLESDNFDDFESNHLAMKLAERAAEIGTATEIFPDLGLASSLSENKAALAVYEVGKMEFVFIAPMSEEKILASKLFQMQSGFEEISLDDETAVYSREIEIDRARQRQKILFANFRGRLILATSEKYFLQTLDNIKGKTPKNRLAGDPLFARLAEKAEPNLVTLWLNHEKLNNDWYFKHYWLMSGPENLKELRAGMFDLEIQDKKAVERRVFFTAATKTPARIKPSTANRLNALIPADVPFGRIETAARTDFDETAAEILFDARNEPEKNTAAPAKKDYYFRDWKKSYSYSELDRDFSEQIDETDDAEILPEKSPVRSASDLKNIIEAAAPEASVRIFSPQTPPAPLFFENRQALVVALRNPARLNRPALETALSEMAQRQFTVSDQTGALVWTDFAAPGVAGRQLAMPGLGRKIFYAVRQDELILANGEELLKEISASKPPAADFAETFDKYTVIRPRKGRAAFHWVFRTLENDPEYSTDGSKFFTKNIGGLLDVISGVEQIEIKQTSAPNFLFEEIAFVLKEKPD
jgi:hypothetical protein